MKCVVLLPNGKIALGKLAQALMYGATTIAVEGNFDEALRIVRELGETGKVEVSGVRSSLSIEAARRAATDANQSGWERITARAREVRARSRVMPSGLKREEAYSGLPDASASCRMSSMSVLGSPNCASQSRGYRSSNSLRVASNGLAISQRSFCRLSVLSRTSGQDPARREVRPEVDHLEPAVGVRFEEEAAVRRPARPGLPCSLTRDRKVAATGLSRRKLELAVTMQQK